MRILTLGWWKIPIRLHPDFWTGPLAQAVSPLPLTKNSVTKRKKRKKRKTQMAMQTAARMVTAMPMPMPMQTLAMPVRGIRLAIPTTIQTIANCLPLRLW